jgi:hypothetical protein
MVGVNVTHEHTDYNRTSQTTHLVVHMELDGTVLLIKTPPARPTGKN